MLAVRRVLDWLSRRDNVPVWRVQRSGAAPTESMLCDP